MQPFLAFGALLAGGVLSAAEPEVRTRTTKAYGIERTVTVIRSAEAVEATRKAFEAVRGPEIEAAAKVIMNPGGSMRWRAFRGRPDQAIPLLLEGMEHAKSGDPRLEAKAAAWLCSLDDPRGRERLLSMARREASEERRLALETIAETDFEVRTPEESAFFIALLSDRDPAVREAAVRVCGMKMVPGASRPLLELLRKGWIDQQGNLPWYLGRLGELPEAIPELGRLLRDRPPGAGTSAPAGLYNFALRSDPSLAGPAKRELEEHFLTLGVKGVQQDGVRKLAFAAGPRSIPLLKELIATSSDPFIRADALEGLGRLDAEGSLDLLLSFIDEKGDSYQSQRAAQGLIDSGSTAARRAILERIDRLDPYSRMRAGWKFNGFTLNAALSDMAAAGLLASIPTPRLIDRQRMDSEAECEADLLPEVLQAAKVLHFFDDEADEVPARHDELIDSFAGCSGGEFSPRGAWQKLNRKGSADRVESYTVEFIHRGALFRFEAEYRSDWYDAESVVNAINVALEEGGSKKRFINLFGGGQMVYHLFGEPEVVLKFAARYFLPPGGGADEAMRIGQEFERKAIEDLRKKGL